jgi:hypothetical protein
VKKSFLSLPVVVGLLVTLAIPQARNNYPKPPEPQDSATTQPTPAVPSHRIDLVRVQQEADELARTAQTIPSDVASLRKGMLPKDVIQKLKQIEKLSKRLRAELNP